MTPILYEQVIIGLSDESRLAYFIVEPLLWTQNAPNNPLRYMKHVVIHSHFRRQTVTRCVHESAEDSDEEDEEEEEEEEDDERSNEEEMDVRPDLNEVDLDVEMENGLQPVGLRGMKLLESNVLRVLAGCRDDNLRSFT